MSQNQESAELVEEADEPVTGKMVLESIRTHILLSAFCAASAAFGTLREFMTPSKATVVYELIIAALVGGTIYFGFQAIVTVILIAAPKR